MRDEDNFDVVVVGGGGAGLAAAVRAAETGASVMLLEKEQTLGGTTAIAIGSITAPMTDLQQKKGISDDVHTFEEDMRLFTGDLADRDSRTHRAFLAREAPATMTWLRSLGIPFVGPFPEPPHRVSRMHNVVPSSRTYIEVLARSAQSHGVKIATAVRVTQLLSDMGGHVSGVLADFADGTERPIYATRGVVLATGDYSANRELKNKYLHPKAGQVAAANPGATGDGHVLAGRLGAHLVNMDIAKGPQLRFPPPPRAPLLQRLRYRPWTASALAAIANRLPAWMLRPFATQLLTAWMSPSTQFLEDLPLLVDRAGRAVVDNGEGLPYALLDCPGQSLYLFVDSETAARFSRGGMPISTAPGIAYAYFNDYRRARGDLVHEYPSFDVAARECGINPEGLSVTYAALEEEDPSKARRLHAGPVFVLGPVVPIFTTTEGGIEVNERCQVMDGNGSPVDGLFAAGSAGQGGLILAGHGIHILWAMTSGRISGREAAGRSL